MKPGIHVRNILSVKGKPRESKLVDVWGGVDKKSSVYKSNKIAFIIKVCRVVEVESEVERSLHLLDKTPKRITCLVSKNERMWCMRWSGKELRRSTSIFLAD